MAISADNEYEVAKPQQQRAIETTNRILEAAYDIVAYDGYQALTTNSVAERAGVNIRSVYRYFEDKNAILVHLAQRERDTRATKFGAQFREFDGEKDLEAWVQATLRLALDVRMADPRANSLYKILRALPDFAEFTREADAEIAEGLGRAIRLRFPSISVKKSHYAARICYDLAQTFVNSSETVSGKIDGYFNETARAATLYLRSLEDAE
ncbi:MAG: TetR/AcrR family transcriptional regulator [Acidimicrobiaceae bacterium]